MTTERLSLLNRIVDNYSDQEKENLEIYYLEGLMAKIAENQIDGNDNLIEKIDSIIERLPRKTNTNKLVYDRKLLNNISNLKSYIKEKYNFVPKGYYKKTYLLSLLIKFRLRGLNGPLNLNLILRYLWAYRMLGMCMHIGSRHRAQ